MRMTFTSVLLAATLGAGGAAYAAPPSQGEQVFDRWCSACHALGIFRHPGTSALAAKYGDSKPAALEERTDLTPPLVKYFVRNGVSIMPMFRKTEITDSELDALADYLGHHPAASKRASPRFDKEQ